MKHEFLINVRGKSGATYSFTFEGDEQYLEEWLSEGFEILKIEHTIPLWVCQLGLAGPWMRVQSAWQFLRLW